MKSILDPTFKYHSSLDTDLRRTFRRIREEVSHANSERFERPPRAPRKSASIAVPRFLRIADRQPAVAMAVPIEAITET